MKPPRLGVYDKHFGPSSSSSGGQASPWLRSMAVSGLGMVELADRAGGARLRHGRRAVSGHGYGRAGPRAGRERSQEERWLPGLAAGELRGAVGTRELLPDGDGADVVIVLESEAGLVGTDGVEPLETIDPTRRYGRVADISSLEELPGDIAVGMASATAVASAELVGVAQRALDMTVAYVKERRQFDTPVGAFQAVSHKCAGMLLATEGARSATYYAAWAADAAPERLAEGSALAKAAASDAGRRVTADAIQAHGGIGFTWEADLHWLFKRAQLTGQHLGGGHTHRTRLAALAAAELARAAA